jgi:hypothetical protein
VFGQLWPEQPGPEFGLTTARQFQGAFGPIVLSFMIVALQTRGQEALVRIFELLAAGADNLEASQRRGTSAGQKGAEEFWIETLAHLRVPMESLWSKFWEGIDRPVPQQK